jgi:dGTPase
VTKSHSTSQPRLLDRAAKEEREARELAPCALRSSDSLGRKYPEEEDDLRTCWERDRDRIIHCTGFRRLMYKTQVFVNREGDHFRTRLTHSLEVSQVARSIGRALRLNEPFCEALALAHDIGHPPFGHRGEWALDELMKGHGGFRHNFQVLRVVDLLERRSPEYPGLNLTRELRESLLKHEKDEDWPDEFRPKPLKPFLEAQVVDLADSTAYDMHDVEDGLSAGIFSEEQIASECAIWRGAREQVELRHPGFLDASTDQKLRIKRIANEMLKICINDLIEASAERLEAAHPDSAAAARGHKRLLIGHSRALKTETAELQRFLDRRFYKHKKLQELTQHAASTLQALFRAYVERPQEMAPWYRQWADRVGLHRAVCDYLAGMTDRFAEQESARLSR